MSLTQIEADLALVRTVYFSNRVEASDHNTIAQVLWDMRDYLEAQFPDFDTSKIDTVMTVASDALIRHEWQNEEIEAILSIRNLLQTEGWGADCLTKLDEILARLTLIVTEGLPVDDPKRNVLVDHHNAKKEALEQILWCLQHPPIFSLGDWPRARKDLTNLNAIIIGKGNLDIPEVLWTLTKPGTAERLIGATAADINNDDTFELVSVWQNDTTNLVWIRAYKLGEVLWTWDPLLVNTQTPPGLYDVQGDGLREVLAAILGTSTKNAVKALRGTNGSLLWTGATTASPLSSPGAADIDHDDQIEVVVTKDLPGKVICLKGVDGTIKWEISIGDVSLGDPVLLDVNGDEKLEVFVQFFDGNTPNPGKIIQRCLNPDDGSTIWNEEWDVDAGSSGEYYAYWGSIAAADIDNDGDIEAVFLTSCDGYFATTKVSWVRSRKATDGTEEWMRDEWDNDLKDLLAVADINRDDIMEIIVHRVDPDGNSHLRCYHGNNGDDVWERDTDFINWIAIADVDGDNDLEIITATLNRLEVRHAYPIDSADPGGLAGRGMWTEDLASRMAVMADLNADGKLELIHSSREVSPAGPLRIMKRRVDPLTVVEEHFNNLDNWTAENGGWSIEDGHLKCTGPVGTEYFLNYNTRFPLQKYCLHGVFWVPHIDGVFSFGLRDLVTGYALWAEVDIFGGFMGFNSTGEAWIDYPGTIPISWETDRQYSLIFAYDPVGLKVKVWLDGILKLEGEVRDNCIGFDIRPFIKQYDFSEENPLYLDDIYLKRERS